MSAAGVALAFESSTPFLVSETVAIDRVIIMVAGRKAGREVAPSRRVEVRRADILFGAVESGLEESVSSGRIQHIQGRWRTNKKSRERGDGSIESQAVKC